MFQGSHGSLFFVSFTIQFTDNFRARPLKAKKTTCSILSTQIIENESQIDINVLDSFIQNHSCYSSNSCSQPHIKEGRKNCVPLISLEKDLTSVFTDDSCHGSPSSVDVVVGVDGVHGLEEFVEVDERSYDDQGSENTPTPEGAATYATPLGASELLVADSVADSGNPHQRRNAKGKPGEEEIDEAIVHGVLAVTTLCHQVDLFGNVREEHDGINAQRDDVEKDELQEASLGAELTSGRIGYGCSRLLLLVVVFVFHNINFL